MPESIIASPISFPAEIPAGYCGKDETEPVYDPTIHLQITPPEYVIGLDYKKYKFPFSEEDKRTFPGMSVSAPFRVVSDEGLRVLRSIYQKNKPLIIRGERQSARLRGLGYTSQFIRDFNNCRLLAKFFGHMANDTLAAHTMPMNYSHTNIGDIGEHAPVDQWHADSVEYVMVLIISDIQDMVGGELEVIMHSSQKAFQLLVEDKLTKDDILVANYKSAGYCMFMQGSKMVHHVSPVISAREPRISMVNSYVSCDVTRPDTTRLATFMNCGDPREVSRLDFARHKAWRTKAILDNVLETTKFSDPPDVTLEKMRAARDELINACNLLEEKTTDSLPYFNEKAKSMVVESKDGMM